MKHLTSTLGLTLSLGLALCGCSTTQPIPVADTLSAKITGLEQGPGADISLYNKQNFDLALTLLEQQSPPLAQLIFLRGYSYFGDVAALSDADYRRLAIVLSNVAQASAEVQEQLAVVGYRFFADKARGEEASSFVTLLGQQLARLSAMAPSTERDYALLETLRGYGFLLNEARKHPQSGLNEQLLASDASDRLLTFAASAAAITAEGDWPRMNAYWALAQYRLALPASDNNEPTDAETWLDQAVKAIASRDAQARGASAKQAYTLGYHVNRFGGKTACEQDALCVIPALTEALPQRHVCSDSLYILSQDLTAAELEQTCVKLTSQEQHFHTLLKTERVATANDLNTALQVVAFKNWSQYNAYGQLLFDIGTDNGGMYIEGTPSKPGNQASFFAFRQWWIAPEFAIWNLNHEYVHYLDGRFVKYGGFEHFPGKMVWWAEGLAEYVSKGNTNPEALKLAAEKRAETPTLATIFATEYPDGLDRTYRWSYLAIRYLAENKNDDLVALSRLLKSDYFEGYDQLLGEIAAREQTAFSTWLEQLLANQTASSSEPEPLPRKINRYAYRDYLQPAHLPLTGMHFHY